MPDVLTPLQRSRHMAAIKSRDTKPELAIRRLLHRLGYRFRVQLKGVPGRPDVAFTARKKAIMVHGCFWHGHEGCPRAHLPRTRSDYWAAKFARNKLRDARLLAHAGEQGWEMLVVWECEVGAPLLAETLRSFLGTPRRAPPVTTKAGVPWRLDGA